MKLNFINLETLENLEIDDTEFLKDIGIIFGDSYYADVYNKQLEKVTRLYHQSCILDIEYISKGNFIISTKSWDYLFNKLFKTKILLMSYEDVTVKERYLEQLLGGLNE